MFTVPTYALIIAFKHPLTCFNYSFGKWIRNDTDFAGNFFFGLTQITHFSKCFWYQRSTNKMCSNASLCWGLNMLFTQKKQPEVWRLPHLTLKAIHSHLHSAYFFSVSFYCSSVLRDSQCSIWPLTDCVHLSSPGFTCLVSNSFFISFPTLQSNV